MNKNHLLYAFAAGLIVADAIPTVSDSIYFTRQRVNKQKLEEGKINPKQYWQRDTFNYYFLNVAYWSVIAGASIALGKDYSQKRNIFIGLLAAGAVFAVIHKNIKKDEEFYATHKLIPNQPT